MNKYFMAKFKNLNTGAITYSDIYINQTKLIEAISKPLQYAKDNDVKIEVLKIIKSSNINRLKRLRDAGKNRLKMQMQQHFFKKGIDWNKIK